MALLPIMGGLMEGAASLLNYGEQKKAQRWQRQAQEITWQREDNAAQRRVADLKAAGLSPVLAAGSAASTSAPIQIGAPQMGESGISKAAELMRMKQEVATSAAQALALQSQTNKNNMEALSAGKEVEKKGLEINRMTLENAIRARDFDIIKRLGIRSDINGTAANVGQFLEGGKNLFSQIGSMPAVSAALGEASKITDRPGYKWTGRSWVKVPVDTRSGSQPVRGPR